MSASPPASAQRLIALGADGADILQRLGVWDQVVGVTAFYHPPKEAEKKPRVSGFSTGNLEAILKLEPTLVITSTDVQHQMAAELIRAGVTVWAMNARSLSEIFASIRQIGHLVGRGPEGMRLAAELERELEPVQRNGHSSEPRPRVYFEEWPEPLITGIGWVSELIERAGGDDIFSGLRHQKKAETRTVAPDDVLAKKPEIIFASWCGKPVQKTEIIARRGWDKLPAVQARRIVEIPSDHILQAGPGLARGYALLKREIAKLLPAASRRRYNSRVARVPRAGVSSSLPMTTPNLTDPRLFINRELSWLAFNRRVLEEAQDATQPLLERVRFLGIVSSNLDEFFEVRVAGIKQLIEHESDDAGPDALTPRQVFSGIRSEVLKLIEDQYELWHDKLLPGLGQHGVFLHQFNDLSKEDQAWATKYFHDEVFPVLTPLAVDASHPFPQLQNKSHNLFLRLKRSSEVLHAVVAIPRVLPRLVRIPHANAHEWHYILIQNLIQNHIHDLFPGLEVEQVYGFRITRNSDLYIDDEEAENLLRTIEDELRKRARGNAVRLEIEHGCPADMRHVLLDIFKLGEDDLYPVNGPLNFLHLMPLASIETLASLRDKPFIPLPSPSLPPGSDTFEIVRHQDVLLHHPYESFNSVVEFLDRAASDPAVLAIKMTLYRTSGDSPIVHSLIRAAGQGKQVAVLVELRARFDEANNINWARQLEEAGVHVVYGLVGLKTHCKVLMIVRRDEDRLRHYLHLGTGNYHPSTARFYTDLSLFTSNPEMGEEVAMLFNTLTGLSEFMAVKNLLVAPFQMHDQFIKLIQHERDLANQGKEGRIIVKLNSLVEESMITALYEASQAGVKIDLIIRGICCLRPGVPGVSDNIRVISIVGRFLEHSRIFCFGNGGKPKVFLGSADWMPRNLFRRVEVVFPVRDPLLRKRITDEIIPAYLSDCVKTRVLGADGVYTRAVCPEGKQPAQAQLTFRNLARKARLRVEAKPTHDEKKS